MKLFILGAAAGLLGGAAFATWLERRRERRLGAFLAFVVHELNVPLTAAQMTISNLLAGVFGPVEPKQLPWLSILRDEEVRLASLLGEVRDFVHEELIGDLWVKTEEVAASQVVSASLAAVKAPLERSGIDCEVVAPHEPVRVRADSDRLVRSLSGLVFYAKKFHATGPVFLKILPANGNGLVGFSVEFNGFPMEPREFERTLSLFYPAEQGRGKPLTTVGLGLGTARRSMQRQGGDFSCETDLDGRFRLTLLVPKSS